MNDRNSPMSPSPTLLAVPPSRCFSAAASATCSSRALRPARPLPCPLPLSVWSSSRWWARSAPTAEPFPNAECFICARAFRAAVASSSPEAPDDLPSCRNRRLSVPAGRTLRPPPPRRRPPDPNAALAVAPIRCLDPEADLLSESPRAADLELDEADPKPLLPLEGTMSAVVRGPGACGGLAPLGGAGTLAAAAACSSAFLARSLALCDNRCCLAKWASGLVVLPRSVIGTGFLGVRPSASCPYPALIAGTSGMCSLSDFCSAALVLGRLGSATDSLVARSAASFAWACRSSGVQSSTRGLRGERAAIQKTQALIIIKRFSPRYCLRSVDCPCSGSTSEAVNGISASGRNRRSAAGSGRSSLVAASTGTRAWMLSLVSRMSK